MHPGETAASRLFGFESFFDFLIKGIIIILGGAIQRQARDIGLCGVPVALVIDIEMRGLIRQSAQGVAKDGDVFSWLHTTKLDLSLSQSPIRVARERCGAKIDLAC